MKNRIEELKAAIIAKQAEIENLVEELEELESELSDNVLSSIEE